MATTTTTTAAEPEVPRGPVTADIGFVVLPPDHSPNTRLYNWVDPPADGRAPRNYTEEPFAVPLTDIRGQETQYTLDNAAVQVLPSIPTKTTYDTYTDDDAVQRIYYPEVEDLLLKHVPGAHKVVIFDHTIRRQVDAARRKPVTRAHVDQTPRAAADRVRLHVSDPDEANRLLSNERYRIINVWRPINGTVITAPLAFADTDTIDPTPGGQDLVPVEHRYPHRSGEIMGVKYRDSQRWLYLSGVRGDERVLIKCADSAADVAGDSGIKARLPHSGIRDPRSVEGEGKSRESIEVRALVFG